MEEERKPVINKTQEIEDIADKEQENLSMVVPSRFQIFLNKLRELTIDKIMGLGQRISEWNSLRKQDASSEIDEIKIRSGDMSGEDRLANQLKANLSLEDQSANATRIQEKMASKELSKEAPQEQIKEAEEEIPDKHAEK